MDPLAEIEKSGYVYVDNIGLADPNGSLKNFVSAFARPISYLDLPLVMDLKPQPGFQPASYAGTGEFDLHTDLTWYENPPKYIAMFCVSHEAAGGGIPLLADGWSALNALAETDIHFLKTHPVAFPPPDHIDYAPFQGPIITEQAGKLQVRFRYDLLEEPETPIRNYFAAIKQHLLQLKISPGSIFVFDNHRMLHGRTELKAGLESNRFFKRMYAEEI